MENKKITLELIREALIGEAVATCFVAYYYGGEDLPDFKVFIPLSLDRRNSVKLDLSNEKEWWTSSSNEAFKKTGNLRNVFLMKILADSSIYYLQISKEDLQVILDNRVSQEIQDDPNEKISVIK